MGQKLKQRLSYWQWRILISMILGYALFYLTRQNLAIAMPALEGKAGFSKEHIGWVFTSFSIVYGIGKFANGFLTDRGSARVMFTVGLIGSALISLLFSIWANIYWFVTLAAASAWFQSMGWPPVAKLITRWYPSAQLGATWGLTNISHQVGSVAILAGGPYLITHLNWQSVFLVPGGIVLFSGLIAYRALRNQPEDVGFNPILEEDKTDKNRRLTVKFIFKRYLLPNKYVWYVCLSTFFLYIVRMGFFFWAPMFLKEVKGISLITAGWVTAGFELAGAIGGIAAGYISDKWFSKRRGLTGVIYMSALILFLIYFWITPGNNIYTLTLATFFVGFFVYGSQVITGVLAADVVSKRAVSSAVGLTGTFGYLASSIFSGAVIGYISHHYGWEICFALFIVSALLGAIFFFLTWSRKK